jgi:hypothetical protein
LEKKYDAHRLKAQINIQTFLELEKRSRLYSEEAKSYHFYRKISKIKMERQKSIEQSRFAPKRLPLEAVLKVPASTSLNTDCSFELMFQIGLDAGTGTHPETQSYLCGCYETKSNLL